MGDNLQKAPPYTLWRPTALGTGLRGEKFKYNCPLIQKHLIRAQRLFNDNCVTENGSKGWELPDGWAKKNQPDGPSYYLNTESYEIQDDLIGYEIQDDHPGNCPVLKRMLDESHWRQTLLTEECDAPGETQWPKLSNGVYSPSGYRTVPATVEIKEPSYYG